MTQEKKQEKKASIDAQKKADFLDARNCLSLGLGMLYSYFQAFPELGGISPLAQLSTGIGCEETIDDEILKNLNELYCKLRQTFYQLREKYDELKNMDGPFTRFDILKGMEDTDGVINWANDWEADNGAISRGGDYFTKMQIAEIDSLISDLGGGADSNRNLKCKIDSNMIGQCKDAIRDADALRKLHTQGEIAEYWVVRGGDGINEADSIMADNSRKTFINGCYELKKRINEGLEPDIFFQDAFQHERDGDMPYEYASRNGRTISQLISDIGMNGILRDIFFRGSSPTRVGFRSKVSRECLYNEGINCKKLRELDIELVKAGAKLTKRKN